MIAVVVVTHDSSRLIPDFVSALPAALAGAGPHRLVAVDSGSTDDTRELIAQLAPQASLVDLGANLGYAAGVNAGIREAGRCDAYLIVNPDVRLGPGAGAHLRAGLAVPGTGITVPRMTDAAGRLLLTLHRRPTVLRTLGEAVAGGRRASRHPRFGEVVGEPARYEAEGTADWASGAAMLVSRACSEAVGPWDESLFLYSEETDFSLRAGDAGFAVRLVPRATAAHLGGEATTSPRLWSLLAVNRVRVYGRRHSRPATAAFALAVGLNELLRSGPGGATHRAALRELATPWQWPDRPARRAGRGSPQVPAPSP